MWRFVIVSTGNCFADRLLEMRTPKISFDSLVLDVYIEAPAEDFAVIPALIVSRTGLLWIPWAGYPFRIEEQFYSHSNQETTALLHVYI
jgi:hypothetical protein